MLIGSLCSGYGGLEMGLQAVVGGSVAWHAETDPFASDVLAQRFRAVPNLGDIASVDWSSVGRVDWLCAGFPCQDLSYAGHGAGILKGTRSGLWLSIADAIGVLRPSYVFLENVAAIVPRRPGLDVVLADLARLGFDADWFCPRASDVGAPHGRHRWFCLARNTQGGARDETPAAQPSRDRRPAVTARGSDSDSPDTTGDEWNEGRPEPEGQLGGSDVAVCGGADVAWGIFEPAIRQWERTLGRPAPRPVEPEPSIRGMDDGLTRRPRH